MTYRLLNQLGYRFAAGASAAGTINDYIASGSNPIRPFPVIHFHGTADSWMLYNGGLFEHPDYWSVEETLNFWIDNNSCMQEPDTIYLPDTVLEDNSTVQKISYLNCADETSIIHYKIIDGGHHWPGGTDDWGGGNLNKDIYANVELWNFFKNYENPFTNMTYSKSLEVNPFYIESPSDTLTVKANMNNPENHPVNVFAIIQGDQSSYLDTLQLFNDGMHGDGDSSDNLWANIKLASGLPEDSYNVDLITHDSIYDILLDFHTPAKFITFGPVDLEYFTFDGTDTVPNPGDPMWLKLSLKNNGSTATATDIRAILISLDTLVSVIPDYGRSFEDIAAGENSTSNGTYVINFSDECPGNTEVPFVVNISSYSQVCWTDTFSIKVIPTTIEEYESIPIELTLHQNYPNPFNSSTRISYSITKPDFVKLKIYDMLGRELATLVNEKQKSGYYKVEFDAKELTSGFYFYTLKAGGFAKTKKMMIMR